MTIGQLCRRPRELGTVYLWVPGETFTVSYTRVNYEDVDAVGDAMHFMRDPLACSELGVTIVECDPGWTGKEHDHAGNGHEEVYVLVRGEATVLVDGDDVEMTAGDALRIDPDAHRQIRNGDAESLFVLVGAP
jgi:mannose-6-phosphate isomerase-like protein (cupin superfamily)